MPSLDRDWARPGPTNVRVRRDIYAAVVVAVGIASTFVAAVLLVRVGVRVYERTLLRTGDRIRYKDALTPADTRSGDGV